VHSGALALQLRSYADALLCFDAALRLSAACVPALLNRAICYHRMGDVARAERDYTAVITLSPVPAAHRSFSAPPWRSMCSLAATHFAVPSCVPLPTPAFCDVFRSSAGIVVP